MATFDLGFRKFADVRVETDWEVARALVAAEKVEWLSFWGVFFAEESLFFVEQLRSDPIPENKAHLCKPQGWSTRHEAALKIAEKHGFGIYDALVVAAACEAGCAILYSEAFQDGQTIDGRLTIRNPFARLSG